MNIKDHEQDLEFVYDDSDTYENEISDLYTFTEEPEFRVNLENFKQLLEAKGLENWSNLSPEKKVLLVMHIIQVIEVTDKAERFKAISWLLYLVQGVYGECRNTEEQKQNCRDSCFLFYKLGIFATVKELLMMEIHLSDSTPSTERKSTMLSLADCKELRSLLNILYTMVETLRHEDTMDSPEVTKLRSDFLHDLEQGLHDKEPLLIVLFNMVLKFCSETSSCLPMRKVLLLVWKLLLTILGGFRSLNEKKIKKRKEAGLPILNEDPLQVVRDMKASTPPTSASDILDLAQPPGKRRARRILAELDAETTDIDLDRSSKVDAPFEEEKVTSIDDDPMESAPTFPVTDSLSGSDGDVVLDKTNGVVKSSGHSASQEDAEGELGHPPGSMTPMPTASGPTLSKDTASIAAKLLKIRKEQLDAQCNSPIPEVKVISGLPWVPKAREKDLEAFLNVVRQKFIGYILPGDLTTDAGLPPPTKDSIKILQKHKYTSISELQTANEVQITKCPLTVGKNETIPETTVEKLYQIMLPNLPQYVIALLKILLAAAPTSKAKNDSINILSDVLPEEMPTMAVTSLKLGIDVNRHREVIVKAISAVLLILLKHLKFSHVYQFEYASQHLVFANCIPLVLKFFNQNIVAYVTTKNTIPDLEFPACVLGEKKELTAESFEGMDTGNVPCWRNLFSSINLLRILNKLVKWKHSRTMMLVVFKSAPILKRALKVRQAIFQLYVLKLLKVQTKYLGRQWRKSNMKTMSAIYQKVRHRLNDDWAFGNDIDARPWDFQQEECELRAFVERFNIRRYHTTGSRAGGTPSIISPVDEDYTSVENNLQNLLQEEIELPLDFRKSYDVWLEREVYYAKTDWDQLLKIPCVQ